ncbi:MAG TPA: ester cyclase [Thermomicrobiales bacterium]|nr:ester cyclase [Thermomicrobiales bacterium]
MSRWAAAMRKVTGEERKTVRDDKLQRADGTRRQTLTLVRAAAADGALVRHAIEEIWNGGDLDLADQVFAPTYTNHGGLIPDLVRGPEAIKVSVALYRAAFPEFRVTVLDLLAQGQTVAIRWEATSPPSRAPGGGRGDGDPGRLGGMTFARVVGGRILESWTNWEAGGVLDRQWRTHLADALPAFTRLTG